MARVFEFATFEINVDARAFGGPNGPIEVPDKVFDIIALLARSDGKLVTKEHLVEQVWRGAPIGDSNISQHLLLARRALGDLRKPYRIIQTIHGRGYRLIPEVRMRVQADRDDTRRAFRKISALQYVRGARHFAKMGSHTSMESSDELCHAALALDRECALALAQLALNSAMRAVCGYSSAAAAFAQSERYASQALALDESCAPAKLAVAMKALFADRAFEEALSTTTNLFDASVRPIAQVMRMLAQFADRRPVDPPDVSSLLVATYAGFISYHSGALHQAKSQLERVVAARPDAGFARLLLGRTLLALEEYSRARVHFETLLFPRAPFAARFEKFQADATAGLAFIAAREGDRFGASALRDDLQRRHPGHYYGPALVAAALGDVTGSARILEHAAATQDPRTFFADTDPLLRQSAAVP